MVAKKCSNVAAKMRSVGSREAWRLGSKKVQQQCIIKARIAIGTAGDAQGACTMLHRCPSSCLLGRNKGACFVPFALSCLTGMSRGGGWSHLHGTSGWDEGRQSSTRVCEPQACGLGMCGCKTKAGGSACVHVGHKQVAQHVCMWGTSRRLSTCVCGAQAEAARTKRAHTRIHTSLAWLL